MRAHGKPALRLAEEAEMLEGHRRGEHGADGRPLSERERAGEGEVELKAVENVG